MRAPAPAYAAAGNTIEVATRAIGAGLVHAVELVGEVQLHVHRDALVSAMIALRDTPGLEYQQLMEIAGVDYPQRAERFDVVYNLLSMTRNHRVQVHVATDEEHPIPSVTGIWPVAGWLEREVYDLYGVLFEGNKDLRRILTDYGFRGHPLRKDFPMTGYTELRYSEEEKRVVYQPVQLAQDFRTFDFLSPWEGAEYILPGDEKAKPAPGAASTPRPPCRRTRARRRPRPRTRCRRRMRRVPPSRSRRRRASPMPRPRRRAPPIRARAARKVMRPPSRRIRT